MAFTEIRAWRATSWSFARLNVGGRSRSTMTLLMCSSLSVEACSPQPPASNLPYSSPQPSKPGRAHHLALGREAPGLRHRLRYRLCGVGSGERVSHVERLEFAEIAIIGVDGADPVLEQN